jgi:hypothetical protein
MSGLLLRIRFVKAISTSILSSIESVLNHLALASALVSETV